MAVKEFTAGINRLDRWGNQIERLHLLSATHHENLDGTDELEVTCSGTLVKGDRLLWIDRQGIWHEHIVDTVSQTHDSADPIVTTATAINSIAELWDDYVENRRPNGDVLKALESAIGTTRWKVGTSDIKTEASDSFYHISAREALAKVAETWGGEIETVITSLDGENVGTRTVNIRKNRGNQTSAKRFTWTKDLISVTRKVDSTNPKTRVYGYGKGVETETGAYGRRLTFAEVNGGLDYVEDAEATKAFGHYDSIGNIVPAVGTFVDEDCEDAATLLAETKTYLEQVKAPSVSYEANVIDLGAFGRDWEEVSLGDRCLIIDKGFTADGLRLQGRISDIKRDLLTGDTEVTFGTIRSVMTDQWGSTSQRLNRIDNDLTGVDAWNAAASANTNWLDIITKAINDKFNSLGANYRITSFAKGDFWSSVPIGDDGEPIDTDSGGWCINISSAGFRIANKLTSDGKWDWRTFGTGDGFSADFFNAGELDASIVKIINLLSIGDKFAQIAVSSSGDELNGTSSFDFKRLAETYFTMRAFAQGTSSTTLKKFSLFSSSDYPALTFEWGSIDSQNVAIPTSVKLELSDECYAELKTSTVHTSAGTNVTLPQFKIKTARWGIYIKENFMSIVFDVYDGLAAIELNQMAGSQRDMVAMSIFRSNQVEVGESAHIYGYMLKLPSSSGDYGSGIKGWNALEGSWTRPI